MGKNSHSRWDCNIMLGDQGCEARTGVGMGTVCWLWEGRSERCCTVLCSKRTDGSPMPSGPTHCAHVIGSQVLKLFFYARPFIIPNQVCRTALFTRMVSLSISRLPHRRGRTAGQAFILRPEPDGESGCSELEIPFDATFGVLTLLSL